VVEIVRSGTFNGITADLYARTNYNDFIGTISNANFYRFWDGTCGSYKVPVRIVAPKSESCESGPLANMGLIEIIHPYLIGSASPGDFEGVIHGWNDPVYDPLLDHGFHEAWANLRVPFLFGDPEEHGGGGVVYVGFQANNFNGELDYIASLPENQGLGLHLQRPQDYAILYRDISKWLRQAKTQSNFVNAGGHDICPISDVIGFGYSYTSIILKAVTSERLNSAWGQSDPIFPRGRVMDGILLGGFNGSSRIFGKSCTQITTSDFIPLDCAGPDHVGEGPMVLVESETDVQFFASTGVRPGPPGNPREWDHYKVHEINSASHLDATYFPIGPILEFFGVDSSATRQNPLNRSPVLRADLINLLNKIRNDTPLPPSSYMKVHGFPKSIAELGVILLDRSTGNGFGGIVLPQAAAPLGLYRGLDCHSAFSAAFDITNPYHYARPPLGSGDLNTGRANFVLESSAQFPAGALCRSAVGLEGLMTPYSVVDDALGTRYCQSLYPTRQAYSNRVIAAADDLIARRLLLPEDREAIIAAAEAQADLYPECVPPRTVAGLPSRHTSARLWTEGHQRSVIRTGFEISLLNLLLKPATSARY
jgi:hypothetical protein